MKVLANDMYTNLNGLPKDKRDNVAIWGWTLESLDLLALAVNERIHVKYFVDYDHTIYKNKTIFDKRVIDREELKACEDIFVVMGRAAFEEEHVWIEENLQGRYLVVDIGEPAAELYNTHGRIYIYGAGIAGGRTLEILREKGVEVKGFLDSNEQKAGTSWCDYPVYSRKVLEKEDAVIISSIYWAEIYELLKNEWNPERIYIDYRNSRISNKIKRYEIAWCLIKYRNCAVSDLSVYNLLKRFYKSEINIYGKNEIAEQVEEILGCLGIGISMITDDIEDLVRRGIDNQMIILTKVNEEANVTGKNVILDSGDFADWGIRNFIDWRPFTNICAAKKKVYRDRLVSLSYEYEGHPYKGFFVHGLPSESKKRIVVLGSSTSDAGMLGNFILSWPEYLAQTRDDIVIINGATEGITSAEECLKLLRDVVHIKPDLVISYSGVNEIYRIPDEKKPFKKKEENDDVFYGLESSMTRAQHWILMERYMQALANVMGAGFIAILHTWIGKREEKELTAYEQLWARLHQDDGYNEFIKEVQDLMKEYDWMYDLTKPFEGIEYEVFHDALHLNNEGNKIIADKISDIIDDYYEKKRK